MRPRLTALPRCLKDWAITRKEDSIEIDEAIRGRRQSPRQDQRKGNMAKGQPITEIEIEHTLLMAAHGLAARDIANILKRSRASVYRILNRYTIAARPADRTEAQHHTAATWRMLDNKPSRLNWAARMRASVNRVMRGG